MLFKTSFQYNATSFKVIDVWDATWQVAYDQCATLGMELWTPRTHQHIVDAMRPPNSRFIWRENLFFIGLHNDKVCSNEKNTLTLNCF